MLQYWVILCPGGNRAREAANQSVFTSHIIDSTSFISPSPSSPAVSLLVTACLLRLQLQGKGRKAPVLQTSWSYSAGRQAGRQVTVSCRGHASRVRGVRCGGDAQLQARRRSGPVSVEMKLKQRMVVLCAVLLLLGLAKIFLLDGGEGTAASRRDLRAFRKVRMRVGCFMLKLRSEVSTHHRHECYGNLHFFNMTTFLERLFLQDGVIV